MVASCNYQLFVVLFTPLFFTLLCLPTDMYIIIIIAEMAVFNVAGYLIEGRRGWPVITASSRGQHSK